MMMRAHFLTKTIALSFLPTSFRPSKVPVPFIVRFMDLGLTLKASGKTILDGVTGEIRPYELTARRKMQGSAEPCFSPIGDTLLFTATRMAWIFIPAYF